MDPDLVNKAVDLIRSCRTLYLYAHGDSGITARAFINRLMKLNKVAVMASEYYEEPTYASLISPDCLALFISYRGGSDSQQLSARILKQRNIPFIVIASDMRETFLTQNASVRLIIPSYETQSDNIATYYSQECFSFYLNLLYGVLYSRSYLENKSMKSRIDKLTAQEFGD